MAISKLSIIKILELLLVITCLGLHYKSLGEADPHTIILASGTFLGYLIILVGLAAGYLMNTPINKRIDLFFSIVGCALFIAVGVLIIQEWEDAIIKTERRKFAMAKGSISIINGVIFFLDIIFTFRD